jgi:hypothetical protein
MCDLKQISWLGLSALALLASCVDVDESGNPIEASAEALSTALDLDFRGLRDRATR